MDRKYKQAIITLLFIGQLTAVWALNREWRIAEDRGAEDSVKTYGFHLRECAKECGIDFTHESPNQLDKKLEHILPIIASMGASVTVVDFDRDGWPDLYVVTSREGGKNRLYRNNRDGTFTDVAEKMGIADLNQPGTGVCQGAVWGDFDNDGYRGSARLQVGQAGAVPQRRRATIRPCHRESRAAPVDQRQQRRLGRFRSRWPPRFVHRGLLGRRRQLVETPIDPDDAGELRVREKRRSQISAAEQRRRHLRGRHGEDGHHQHALDAGGSGGRPVRQRLSRPCAGQRLRRLRVSVQQGRQTLRGGRPTNRDRRHAEKRHERELRRFPQHGQVGHLHHPTSPSQEIWCRGTTCGCRNLITPGEAPRLHQRRRGSQGGTGRLELGGAVRRPEQRRLARPVSDQRLHLREPQGKLLVRLRHHRRREQAHHQ